jgi:3-oxoadipate enol-lactonase
MERRMKAVPRSTGEIIRLARGNLRDRGAREKAPRFGRWLPRSGRAVGCYAMAGIIGGCVAWLRGRGSRRLRTEMAASSPGLDDRGPEPTAPPRIVAERLRAVALRSPDLYVRDEGVGPNLLLLHAFPLSGRMWETQVAALHDRARVIVPDLPGFGLSAHAEVDASADGFTIDAFARRVFDRLERLGIEEVTVVGLSLGAHVALRLAPLLGERLRGLLLASAGAGADAPAIATERHELAAEIEAFGVDAAADAVIPRFLGAATLREAPAVVEQLRSMVRENRPSGLAGALRAMADRPDSRVLLPRLRCPVWCVAGDEDVVTPHREVLAMAAAARDGSYEVIPGAGHLSSIEAPALFNEVLNRLVDDATSRRPSAVH